MLPCDGRSSRHAWKENSKFGKKNLVFSLPRTRRPNSVSRTWAVFDENSKLACIDSYWNQSFGRSVDRQLPFQVQRRRVNRVVNKKSPGTSSSGEAIILMSDRNVRFQSDIYSPIQFALRHYILFSRETCSILVDHIIMLHI